MSFSTDQFIELLSGGRETRGVEFKAAGPRGDPLVFAFVAPASVEVPTQTEMRELLEAAADKMLRRFLARASAAGVALGSSESDAQKYEKHGGFR